MSENKQPLPGVVGPSYTLRSERYDAQETINYYLEQDEMHSGKGQQPIALMPTPGLELVNTAGSAGNRCMYTVSNADLTYIVNGNQVFSIDSPTATPTLISGNLLTTSGTVDAIDNGIQVVFVDGQFGYYITLGTTTLVQIVSDNFFPTDTISYQDGYFIGTQVGTQAFFLSDINDVTFPPLNEENVQGSPDILIAAISSQRQLYMLGARSTEIWWDAGNSSSSPFERQDGKFSQQGCASPYSICQVNESLMWLGTNDQGGAIVFQLDGGMPVRVSTYAVERSIQDTRNALTATAFTYQQEGHYFWCVNVTGLDYTWVYDQSTQLWHKRQSTINGLSTRCIAENCAILKENVLLGDYRNGNIYRYNLSVWTENSLPVYRTRQFAHLSENLNRLFLKTLELDFQMGVGLPGVSPPKGEPYTQYGALVVDPSGVTDLIDYHTPIVQTQPQAVHYSGLNSIDLLIAQGFISDLGGNAIGMGNELLAVTNQVPPVVYNVSRSIPESGSSCTFVFPMQMLDLFWVHSFVGDVSAGTYAAVVNVGPAYEQGELYSLTFDGDTTTALRLKGTERVCA